MRAGLLLLAVTAAAQPQGMPPSTEPPMEPSPPPSSYNPPPSPIYTPPPPAYPPPNESGQSSITTVAHDDW